MINQFVKEKLEGLKLDECWDIHTHLLGDGSSDSGIYIKESKGIESAKDLIRINLFKHYTNSVNAPTDYSYRNHMARCAEKAFDGFKALAFAFTGFHDEHGFETKRVFDYHGE